MIFRKICITVNAGFYSAYSTDIDDASMTLNQPLTEVREEVKSLIWLQIFLIHIDYQKTWD